MVAFVSLLEGHKVQISAQWPTVLSSPRQHHKLNLGNFQLQIFQFIIHKQLYDFISRNVRYLEFVLQPTVSRPVRLGIRPPFGAHDQILSFSSFSFDNYCVVLPRAPSLRRGQVRSLQCNCRLVRSLTTNNQQPITILYRLIWDCVPFLSPLTTRRDCGGSILTRLHTECQILNIKSTIYIVIPCNRLWRPIGLWDPVLSRQSAHRWQ
jgi:hypothetical protein